MDVVDVTLLVTRALERCGVDYFLGGSLASSFQGEPRATNDVDLVVRLSEEAVAPLAAALGPDFDVDSDRQWRDVVQVLRQSRDRLDEGYLAAWSERLGVASLLERASREACDPPRSPA